ncbi:glycoside hydrolase family 16 protein [Granulosicoccus antarcticus]|uniref:Endo-1,3-1,4-beta-glycanase ExsH n=1 Tax=Granulosicoccus antarcticus IMCC3135 TaxID=1192854 RepID=A0A2Z2P2C7_9GAMM|nr:family 16 glycosylhydrolase [Granulosicoccus antarcticus]ASJ74697.1 Endo-1,3-1,4-beta-glycanase ExsH [Granulosicoccus antarcticus IMCC3135]
MNPLLRHSILSLAIASLAACSSSDNTSRILTAEDGTSTDVIDTDTPIDNSDTDSVDSDQPVDTVPDFGDLPDPTIPTVDLLAAPIPGPSLSDPFGSLLEVDNEAATAGGPPTQPKNLRIDLVSNDWAEFSWAPSNDDSAVVAYRILRSDGHVYTIRQDQTDADGNAQREIDKYWNTTSFMDCNYTRFATRLHECAINGPKAGDIFSYEVIAVDDEGQESAPSDPITITYHATSGAAVPLYADPFLDESRFAQNHDLSNTAYFMDKFSVVFEDEFNTDVIDSARWNTQLVFGDETIINGEQQYFVNSQDEPDFGYNPFKIADSILTIEAIPTPEELKSSLPDVCNDANSSGKDQCLFLSGALSTHDKFNMTYGYVESRMKTSDTFGALSSFYLYHRYPGEGVNLHAPEIDIVEYLGENPFGDEDAFQTYHYADVNTGELRSAPTMNFKNPDGSLYSDEFHTYGVLWEPQLVIWYIDGKEIKRMSGPQVARQGMNIVTYLVTGSGWAPTPDIEAGNFPISLEIDYIRAWQRDAYSTNGLYPQ